jgi:hypothetical protein
MWPDTDYKERAMRKIDEGDERDIAEIMAELKADDLDMVKDMADENRV